MTKCLALAASALVFLAATMGARSQGQTSAPYLLDWKVSVGDVQAAVKVMHMNANGYVIAVRFESPSYAVGCLSAYRDLRYTLRDSSGHAVPINQKAIDHPPYEGQLNNHVIAAGRHDTPDLASTCVPRPAGDVWVARAILSDLYPNLAPGSYTLRVTFAPRGVSGAADFPEVPIVIHKL